MQLVGKLMRITTLLGSDATLALEMNPNTQIQHLLDSRTCRAAETRKIVLECIK